MVEFSIFSPTIICIKNRDRMGERKIRLAVLLVFFAYLSAFSHSKKVMPISKRPMYRVAKKGFKEILKSIP